MEVYRAAKSGKPEALKKEISRLQRFSEFCMRGPFIEEFGMGDRESHFLFMEFPRMLHHMLTRQFEQRRPHVPIKGCKSPEAK